MHRSASFGRYRCMAKKRSTNGYRFAKSFCVIICFCCIFLFIDSFWANARRRSFRRFSCDYRGNSSHDVFAIRLPCPIWRWFDGVVAIALASQCPWRRARRVLFDVSRRRHGFVAHDARNGFPRLKARGVFRPSAEQFFMRQSDASCVVYTF